MLRDQQSTKKPAPILYWNPCQGIPPIVITSPQPFLAAQAIVLVFGFAVVLVLLLIS